MKPINLRIAEELGVREQQVAAAISLLDGGATVPFVARYRKEATGALDDTQLRALEERLRYLRELDERRAAIPSLRGRCRFLHAAEGRDLGRNDAFVDADDAVFEGFGDAPDAADVAAVEIGGEPEFGVVGHLDGVGFALEAVERRDRAKGFLLGDDHVRRHIGQHRSARRSCRPGRPACRR
jgi:hypothetical protein